MGVARVMKPAPRLRWKKRHFNYECQDEVDDVETKFKREFFYEMIYTVKMSTEERITQMEQHVSLWGFCYDLTQLPYNAELLKLCQDFDHALRHLESADIDGTDRCEELIYLCSLLPTGCFAPQDVPQFILDNQLQDDKARSSRRAKGQSPEFGPLPPKPRKKTATMTTPPVVVLPVAARTPVSFHGKLRFKGDKI
ncbi:hypothetical protein HPB47_016699 [Ixodes persulcatus]|uniref:Uncharacterized protein n=1 Tax=Ixodes persulcatus TaxID=34615 RepID=A0AC60QQF0_IXOPE|nr:hypothetical protein HPB47_016699 [Ixodes persulcatus]